MVRLLKHLQKESLESRLQRIKQGDDHERESIIKEYIPFIVKTISATTKRYVESENSEEYCIGLEAFNEAIERYRFSKGSFISFAALVIRSRIKDYMKKAKKHRRDIPISQLEESSNYNTEEIFTTEDFTEHMILKNEIKEFEDSLQCFNISFKDLVKESPKHQDTRIRSLRIASYINENKELKEELFKKKKLPISRLVKELDTTAKVLSGNRKFIIATVLILNSSMELLKSYIDTGEGGVTNDL